MRGVLWIGLAVAAACSGKGAQTIETATPIAFKPTKEPLRAQAEVRAEVSAEQPRWYSLDLPFPGPETTVQVVVRSEQTSIPIAMEVYDAQRKVLGHDAGDPTLLGYQQLALDHRGELARIYVNVHEQDRSAGTAPFKLSVSVMGYETPKVVTDPPCDPKHIDPTDPRCQGVSPPCDSNAPDFTNPRCCRAKCALATQGCNAKVYDVKGKLAKIALGLDDEIVTQTPGAVTLVSGGTSTIYVTSVRSAHEAEITIVQPDRIDMTKLAQGEGTVTLFLPEPCKRH